MNGISYRRLVAAALIAALAAPVAAHSAEQDATAAPTSDTSASSSELDAIEARYKAVLKQLEEIEKQQQAIDQLITRAEAIETANAQGAAPASGARTAQAQAAPAAAATNQPRTAATAPPAQAQAPRAAQPQTAATQPQAAPAAQPRPAQAQNAPAQSPAQPRPAQAQNAPAQSPAQPRPAQAQNAPAQSSAQPRPAQAQSAPAQNPAQPRPAQAQPAQAQQASAATPPQARPAQAPAQAQAQTPAQGQAQPRPAQAQAQPQQARPPQAQAAAAGGSAQPQQAPAQRAANAAPANAAPANAQGSNVPVVAAEQRAEVEAQEPDLPRVSNEVGGVTTPKGRIVLEPSMSYSYSSVSRVAIEGFTILPALLVGIIDVVEADRDTYLTNLSARMGLTNRLELELKSSFVSRSDATRSREYLKNSVADSTFHAAGSGMGDHEVGLRWQFKRRSATGPYLVGNLRYKHDNGTDPFMIATQQQLSGEPQFSQELPTGSGFRSVSPSLTFIYPTDPVVFFGSIGYMWTQADDKGTWTDTDGKSYGFGVVNPGDAFRTSFGVGLGLNDRSSLSLSYALDKFTKTYIETASVQDIVGSDVTVGKLLVGYSLKLPNGAPLNVAVGIGTTGDAADTDLTFRMPFTFND